MASNPMQRKTRNSFLLGMIVTLIIAGIIITFLFLQLKEKTEELNAEIQAKRVVYVLKQDVKSGQELTQDMFVQKSVHAEAIPFDATSVMSVIDSWYLQTKGGEQIYTDDQGLYFDRSEENNNGIIEVISNEGVAFTDSDGKIVGNGEYFTFVNGRTKKINSNDSNLRQDTFGAYFIDDKNEDLKTRVWQEMTTGEYYIYKIDEATINTGNEKTRKKEYIDIKNVPVLAKIDMNANTVITPNLVVQSDEVVTDDVREQEYNMVVLPIDLMTNDYVDIRLMTPSGQDFVVISKAKVTVPTYADGTYVTDTIKINLREDEILTMSSAIVEAYGLRGSKLYATKYIEAGMQESASPTYTPNNAVTSQIDANGDGKIDNPNIVEQAMTELKARYTEQSKKLRNDYLQSMINLSEDYTENVRTNIEEDATNINAARQKYLESLKK